MSFPHPVKTVWWRRWLVLPISRVIAWPILFVLGPIRVVDAKRLPKTGPVLIVANHKSDLDPVIVQYACKRPMHFMAKSELFKSKLFALVIKAYGAFPITRDSPDRAALRHSVNLLLEGDPVVIFPEGRTSPGEGMLPLQPGMAMLARTPGVQTICLGLRGVNKILPFATLKFRKGGTVWARWGHPKVFTEADSTADILAWARAELEELRNE